MATAVFEPGRVAGERVVPRVPPLENGARLTGEVFLRRYEGMPEVRKAELIGGVVYMSSSSPVRVDQHGEPDNLMQAWLRLYQIGTFGVKASANSTTRLGVNDIFQPDASLRIIPECGGKARVDARGYLQGPPELVVEIAASTASLDAGEKLNGYRRAGVVECIVWRTEDGELDWWILEGGDYRGLAPEPDGVLRSKQFPGLRLDVRALLAGNDAQVVAALQQGLASPEHANLVAALKSKAESR